MQHNQTLCSDIEQELTKIKNEEITGQRGTCPKMSRMNSLIDQFYILNKLRLYCRFLSYDSFMDESGAAPF